MKLEVRIDDLTAPEVQELVRDHLMAMHGNSPPGHVNALAIDGLRAPEITFWTAWLDDQLCGCGALKELDAQTGELKSMHTLEAFQRKGIAQALLHAMEQAAVQRGYRRLYLETGSGTAFEAAHRLYAKHGFEWCDPFGDYEATDFNVFMMKRLASKPSSARRP